MSAWYDPQLDEEIPYELPQLEVEITPNPVVATLLGPDGSVLVEVHERDPAVGFRLR